MANVRLSQECVKTEIEISGHDVAWHYGAGPFVTLFQPYARLFAQDPSLKGADLRLLFYILSLIGWNFLSKVSHLSNFKVSHLSNRN